MTKDEIVVAIDSLIQEGNQVRNIGYHHSQYGYDYINGEEYEEWISRCIVFLDYYCSSDLIKDNFKEAASSAVGNSESYFHKMMAQLSAFKKMIDIIMASRSSNSSALFEGTQFDKIFISHASLDKDYVGNLIQLLNDIGVTKSKERIFCSSFEGYGIPLGVPIYEYLKDQFNQNILVIFVLSANYYRSAPCLNEMGATWVTARAHHSILLPQFSFSDINGALDTTKIALRINDKEKINSFKDMIIDNFGLNALDGSIWEKDRDKFLQQISSLEQRDKYSNSSARVEVAKVKPSGNELNIELRFINEGKNPVQFQEVEISLVDEDGNNLVIYAPEEFLDKLTIYDGEKRREVLRFEYDRSQFNAKRIKTIQVIRGTSIIA